MLRIFLIFKNYCIASIRPKGLKAFLMISSEQISLGRLETWRVEEGGFIERILVFLKRKVLGIPKKISSDESFPLFLFFKLIIGWNE